MSTVDFDTCTVADLRKACKAQWALMKIVYRD
jgi:hypothetical protein